MCKKGKEERKMNPEDLQGLLHMRRRNYAVKNKKAYDRKRFKEGEKE